MKVEVVLALPQRYWLIELELPPRATALEAAQLSGFLDKLPSPPAIAGEAPPALGIHGRVVPPWTPVAEGDRIEIYRPLQTDPKKDRRARVTRARRA